jgi:hypothetical protein
VGPESGKTIALLQRSQREGASKARLAPALAAVLGATADDCFGSTFRHAAADRQATCAEADLAHSVLVIGEVDEMIPKLILFDAGQVGVLTI